MDDHVYDLLPGYALGCLEADDQEKVISHLDSCELCQQELLAYQSIGDQLGLAAPQRGPSAALKEKVMASVQPHSYTPVAAHPAKRGWLKGLQSLLSPVGLALTVLVAVLALSNVFLWQQVSQLKASKSNFSTVALAGTPNVQNATGMIVISPEGKHGTLVVNNLPSLPESSQYQLWLIKDGQRTSGGVFSVDEDGYRSLYIRSDQPLISFDSFGVTIEPQGGSPGPTGPKVLGSQ